MKKMIEEWNKDKYSIVFYGSNPRTILIGEKHDCSPEYIKSQIQLCSLLEIDLLLHEFARNYIFDFEEKKVYENPLYKATKESLNFAASDSDIDSIFPYEIVKFRDWLNTMTFKTTLKEYELARSIFDIGEGSNLRMILENLPSSLKKVIGCDKSQAELYFYENQNNIELTQRSCARDHHFFREARFAQVITDYKHETDKPLIAIMGAYHIKPESFVHKKLKENEISYICIDQTV